MLNSADAWIRAQGICGLSYMHNGKTLPVLIAALRHEDSVVRGFACTGLSWLGRDERLRAQCAEALWNVLRCTFERNDTVRVSVASSLVEIGERVDASEFTKALVKRAGNVALITRALARMGRKESVWLIIQSMSDADSDENVWIAKDLEALLGVSIGVKKERWLEWYELNSSMLPPQDSAKSASR
jgi:HEAT repeat protein